MAFESQGNTGSLVSPGGFEFGVQGWSWGEPRPKSITFFLDGSAMVCDQHGRPIKGAVGEDGKNVWFATTPPPGSQDNSTPYERRFHEEGVGRRQRTPLATHKQVIDVLTAERVDWLKLDRAGLPQLPYEELKKVPNLQPTSEVELRRIPDPELRKAAVMVCRELAKLRVEDADKASEE